MNPRMRIKREDSPLLDYGVAKERAEAKRERGISNAAHGAENIDPGFNERALAHVEQYARMHGSFMAEDVRETFKDGGLADQRAFGPVMRMAQARGFIVADGAAPANSSNRSFKTRWKSKLFGGGA